MTYVAASPAATVRAPVEEPGYYSVSQAATLLGVNRVTVWRWIRAGRLPASRFGHRTTRIAREDLEQALSRVVPADARLCLVESTDVRAETADGPVGEHVVQFYEADEFLLNAASDFVGAALRAGDAGVVIATEAHRAGIEERLRAAGLDLATAGGRGHYVAVDAAETVASLMVDGQPDAGRFAELVGGIIARAREGGRRVHAFGEMVALLATADDHAGAVRLEALWNDLLAVQSFSLFCAYPIEAFDGGGYAAPFATVCSEHARVIPTEGYTALGDPDDRLREIARLQQKARSLQAEIAERERAEAAQALLARAGEVLATSLDWEATLDHVIGLAMPVLSDFGFFDVVEAEGQVRRIARAHQDPRRQAILDASRWAPADHTDLNVCALTTGRTGIHTDITDAWLRAVATGPEHLAVMRNLAFRSVITVPLRHGDRTLGALTLFYADSGRRHTEADVALVEELARRAGMAVENARLYGEAQAAIRARDEFLSIASHELRNPVAGMKGAAQMLRRAERRGQFDAERLDRYVDIIERTANRLAVLTEDLLDVSRLQQGVLPLRPQRIDIVALIGSVIARLQAQSEAHRLVQDLGRGPCPAVVDPDRLEQVVENLLSNAIKYAPDGGEIRVTLAAEGGAILLSVSDAGIGLPAGALERIFEPFGRAPNAVGRNIPGLGLGLYICRQIAEQHDGRLWAESDGEGQGTTMRLRLPAPGCGARGAPLDV